MNKFECSHTELLHPIGMQVANNKKKHFTKLTLIHIVILAQTVGMHPFLTCYPCTLYPISQQFACLRKIIIAQSETQGTFIAQNFMTL